MAVVRRHLEHPSQRCAVVVVEGAAGIGKTALAARVAHDASRLHWSVLTGVADADARTPLATFFDLFGPTDLLDVLPCGPSWSAQASMTHRQQLYRQVRDGLSELVTGRGLVVVLDDVHDADPESIDLLVALLRHPPTAPTVLLLCSRADRLPAELEQALAGKPADRLRLGPLDADAVATLCGPATTRRRQVLLSASRGNPRYLQILSALPTSTVGDLDAPAESAMCSQGAANFDAEIIAGLRLLPERERLIAGTAALLGRDVDIELVTTVVGLPADEVIAGVDALAARDVLSSRDDRLEFCHPLVRAAAYRLCRPAWRVAAHRRALDELRRRGARHQDLAAHVAACAQLGDRRAALLLGDAARASLRRDPATCSRWLEVALHVLPGEDVACRDGMSVLLARAYALTGRPAAAAELLRSVSDARRGGADVGLLLAQCERACGHVEEASALLLAELTRDRVDPATTIAVHLELAGLDILRGKAPRDLSSIAGVAPQVVPRELSAAVACVAAIASVGQGGAADPVTSVAHAARLVDGLREDELTGIVGHLHLLAWSEYHVDRLDDAARHVERARAAAARSGVHEAAPCLQVVRSAVAARRGALELALQAAAEAEELAVELGLDDYRIMAAAARLLPTLWRDGPLAAQALLARLPDVATVASPWARSIVASWTAEALLTLGKADAAAASGTVARQAGDELGDPQQPRMFAVAAATELLRGDVASATDLSRTAYRLAESSGRDSQRGAAQLALARVALCTGDHARAANHASAAIAHYERAGVQLMVGQARLQYADAALAAGDQDRAQLELAAAKRIFETCGAAWLGLLATNAQRRAGSTVPRYAAGSEGLSRREQEIAAMLCEGLTNKAIADHLVLSVRTIDSHVARILAKLGVSSRAAVARRLGNGAAG